MSSIERVKMMVKNYQENKVKAEVLQEEMKAYVPLTASEVLEMLNHPGKPNESVLVQKDPNYNRTYRIATSYCYLTWLLNKEAESEMTKEYITVIREVDFVRYAIRALPRYYRELMTYSVLENHRWGETCVKFNISGSELSYKNSKAIERMAKTFDKQKHYFGFEEETGGED